MEKSLNGNFPIYLDATTEDNYNLAAGDLELDQNGFIQDNMVPVRYRQNLVSLACNRS